MKHHNPHSDPVAHNVIVFRPSLDRSHSLPNQRRFRRSLTPARDSRVLFTFSLTLCLNERHPF